MAQQCLHQWEKTLHIDGLMQGRCYSIANALELLLSCTNTLICNVLSHWSRLCSAMEKKKRPYFTGFSTVPFYTWQILVVSGSMWLRLGFSTKPAGNPSMVDGAYHWKQDMGENPLTREARHFSSNHGDTMTSKTMPKAQWNQLYHDWNLLSNCVWVNCMGPQSHKGAQGGRHFETVLLYEIVHKNLKIVM